jgi:hypothetical protein
VQVTIEHLGGTSHHVLSLIYIRTINSVQNHESSSKESSIYHYHLYSAGDLQANFHLTTSLSYGGAAFKNIRNRSLRTGRRHIDGFCGRALPVLGASFGLSLPFVCAVTSPSGGLFCFSVGAGAGAGACALPSGSFGFENAAGSDAGV